MKFEAWADTENNITCVLSKNHDAQAFYLDNQELEIIDSYQKDDYLYYSCQCPFVLDVNKKYIVSTYKQQTLLKYRFIVKTEEFNQKYQYNKKLGALYSKEKTEFRLWAPTTYKAWLILIKDNQEIEYPMTKEKGVFNCIIHDDLENCDYLYKTECNGEIESFTDPYSLALRKNGKYSVVIDYLKIKRSNDFINIKDPIIYELSIRDFTSDPNTNIVNKSKYLGLVENAKTNRETNCGLDYLKELGISHVQIMPVLDIGTIDEYHPKKTYNWGYDPISYTTLEGSYSLNPDDPYARIFELQKMVEVLHQNRIGVIYDVVFNHLYDWQNRSFSKAVPYYYYRYDDNKEMCNGSGCGNDLASEMIMVKHLLSYSLKLFLECFMADGIRFDLLGLMDLGTFNLLKKQALSCRSDFIIYGEGWNLKTALEEEKKTIIENKPEVAFFNGNYRDILRGDLFNHPGYLSGDSSKAKEMINCLLGSTIKDFPGNIFDDYKYSINYIECHDNQTLSDRVERNEYIRSCLMCLFLSFGRVFLHSGVEFKRTKNHEDNTYNLGDNINMIDYSLKDQNQDLVDFVKELIKLRKELKIYELDYSVMKNRFSYEIIYQTTLKLKINTKDLNDYQELYLIINPHEFGWKEEFNEEYVLLFDTRGNLRQRINEINIENNSVYLLGKK